MTREGRATVVVAWRARSTVERPGGGTTGQTRGVEVPSMAAGRTRGGSVRWLA